MIMLTRTRFAQMWTLPWLLQGDINVYQQRQGTGLLICLNEPLHCPMAFVTTLKQVNFAGNLISRRSRKVQIHEIKLLRSCKYYIDNNGKFSIFAKSSCREISNNFQFEKKKKPVVKLICFTVYEMLWEFQKHRLWTNHDALVHCRAKKGGNFHDACAHRRAWRNLSPHL